MTKLEEKLIQLGYVKLTHNYMTKLTRYKKEFAFSYINFHIRDNEIVMYGVSPTCDYQTQYEVDDLQQAYNQLQKDLEVLKNDEKN